MSKVLRRVVFGNPGLRQTAKSLTPTQITSSEIQTLIEDMRHTLTHKKYGVAIAAPQVGRSVAIVVVGIKSTPTRPNRKPVAGVYINPVITKYYGAKQPEWEGCISLGALRDTIFAQTLRHPKIDITYMDESGQSHSKTIDGFLGHVLQHETDHLNGILFVDHVKDATSFMNASEYRKRIAG